MTRPLTLLSSEAASSAFFRRLRGPARCSRCSALAPYVLESGRYRCRACRHTFALFGGTWLARTRLPSREVAHLLYLFVLGVPSYRARHYTGGSLKTMQRVYTRFREAIYQATLQELEPLSGVLELDETLFGPRNRPGKRGWGATGKRVVFGIYQRNGHVLCFPVPSRKRATLFPLIEEYTKPGSLYITDEYIGYASLAIRSNHVVVQKKDGLPQGRDHLNGIEGFWSYAKHWLYQYRGVPQHHFELYLKEIEWRFNHRNDDLIGSLGHVLVSTVT